MNKSFPTLSSYFAILVGMACLLESCSLSQPPAPADSKSPPIAFLKVVPYSEDQALKGYFTLADQSTNQVAAAGRLRLHVYTSTSVSIGSGEGDPIPGVPVKNILYDNTFAIGATNFHWESFGSMVTVNDLAFRFEIPYSYFRTTVRQGKVATFEVEFQPDNGEKILKATRKVSLY